MRCHTAKINPPTMHEIVAGLLKTEFQDYCPHGRPVVVKVTKYELEKLFKRA